MKIFLTGANGLVGSFVLKQLISEGHEAILLLRPHANTEAISEILSSCETVQGDLFDIGLLAKAMETCDAVVHCAGKVSFDPRKTAEIYETNVQGTANVVNACLLAGIKKLVHVSSIAALGRKDNATVIDEKAKWEDGALNSPYAKSKYLAELEVFRGAEEGLDISIVNPSIVIGPGAEHRSSTKLLAWVKKMPWFYPKGYVNIVDVRDVANSICQLLILWHPNRLILNSSTILYKDFYSIVYQALGFNGKMYCLPTFLLRCIAFLHSIKRFFTGGEPLLTRESIKLINKKHEYKSLYYNTLMEKKLTPPEESISWALKKMYNK